MDPFLDLAIQEARLGSDEGGIPIGAALVNAGELELRDDATCHSLRQGFIRRQPELWSEDIGTLASEG